MKKETLLVHTSSTPETQSGCVNTPIYRSSTILFPTMESYYAAGQGEAFYETGKDIRSRDFSYSTTGTPTTYALQKAIAELEHAEHAVISPSGLSAITHTLLSFLKTGDHLLMTDAAYGPTRRFCHQVLKRYGIETTYYDPLIGSDIKHLIQDNTKLIFTESPGSLTLEVQDIPAIAKEAHKRKVVVVTDNSWASPLYCTPLELGADISIQAATKYIGGHSDLLLGTIAANTKYFDPIATTHHHFGSCTSPDECYLALRGLRSMGARIKQHEASALEVIAWLQKRPEVSRILYPTLKDHPGHKIFKRDFSGSTGLFSFILAHKYNYKDICRMIDGYSIFGIGASWGGFESLALHFDPKTVRTAKPWKEKGECVRLYIGLEDVDDLIKDLEAGFKRLNKR
jgi:cysteine-S-conjugate beta-lyase